MLEWSGHAADQRILQIRHQVRMASGSQSIGCSFLSKTRGSDGEPQDPSRDATSQNEEDVTSTQEPIRKKWQASEEEAEKLRQIFQRNAYPDKSARIEIAADLSSASRQWTPEKVDRLYARTIRG